MRCISHASTPFVFDDSGCFVNSQAAGRGARMREQQANRTKASGDLAKLLGCPTEFTGHRRWRAIP